MALESESLLLLHVAPCSFRPGGGGESTDREREQLCAPTGHGTRGPTHGTALAPGRPTSPHTLGGSTVRGLPGTASRRAGPPGGRRGERERAAQTVGWVSTHPTHP